MAGIADERELAGPVRVAALLRTPGLDATDARVLLQHVLGVEHAQLIAHAERELSDQQRQRFLALVERRRRGEPIAYLIGWREFYGRRFGVDPAVLIPRPESELLVDHAVRCIASRPGMKVLDLGTGSGNIALTLALECRAATLIATDMSAPALHCARSNAQRLGAMHVEFFEGNWFTPVARQRFDLIVSNPPYVAEGDIHLQLGDVRFEPRHALTADPDGLASIRTIVGQAKSVLSPGGWLMFEHGYDQAAACARLLAKAGFRGLFLARDLAGLARVSGGRAP
jgi:release factor glutamine methyltransferase